MLTNGKRRKLPGMGKELKAWRKLVGFTQTGAAVWFDVPLRTYQEWEQDRQDPALKGPIRKLMAQKTS